MAVSFGCFEQPCSTWMQGATRPLGAANRVFTLTLAINLLVYMYMIGNFQSLGHSVSEVYFS